MAETIRIKDFVLPYLDLDESGCDLGCGNDKIHPEAIGMDIHGSDVDCNLLEGIPFDDHHFGWVYSSHLIEDFEDTEFILKEMVRILKDRGKLIIYMPHKDYYPNIGTKGANPSHKHDFYPEEILTILRKITKFKLIKCESYKTLYSFLIIAEVRK